jgi:hypothetical protein
MTDILGNKFIRSMLSGIDGRISNTRVCITAIVSFVIGAGVALICKIHAPITVAEFNSFLSSSATFVATVCGPLYLINKGAGVMHGMSSSGSTGDNKPEA